MFMYHGMGMYMMDIYTGNSDDVKDLIYDSEDQLHEMMKVSF